MKKVVEVTKEQKLPASAFFMGIATEDVIINPDDSPLIQTIIKKTLFYYEMTEADYKEFCKLNNLKDE